MKEGYDGLDGIELVMDRGSGASQVVDLVNLQKDGFNDVVADEFEVWVPHVVKNVLFPSREEIINHDHAVASFNQTVHQVASNETGSTGHQDPLLLLAFNPERDPSPLLLNRRRPFQQHPPSRQSRVGLKERLVRSRHSGWRWEELEEDGGDGHAHEEERHALAKHVTDPVG